MRHVASPLPRREAPWPRFSGRRGLVLPVLRLVPPLALLLLGVLAWQAFVQLQHIPDYLLPAPSAIWQTTLDERDTLLANSVPTLEIAVLGFALAVVAGLIVALAIHLSRLAELTLYPILIASQAVPVLALAPILVILFGFSIWPKLIVVALICFFPITVNAVDGLKSVDPDLVDLMRTMGANRWLVLRDVEFPSALPFLFSGARVAVTFSVVGALYGEWVGSTEGLAYLITQKQAQFDTPAIFSAMAILTLIGVGLFALVSALERFVIPWPHHQSRQGRGAHTGGNATSAGHGSPTRAHAALDGQEPTRGDATKGKESR